MLRDGNADVTIWIWTSSAALEFGSHVRVRLAAARFRWCSAGMFALEELHDGFRQGLLRINTDALRDNLVPLIFGPYAADLAQRMRSVPASRVLEIAAGTGVVTRELASTLPAGISILATDLNQTMLDQAAVVGTSRPVEWRQADATQLPFPSESFDAVVCQFGVMFFPVRRKHSPKHTGSSNWAESISLMCGTI